MIRAAVATEVADAIGRKWAVEVAEKLEDGPRRYNELLKEVGDQITPKVFTRVLRRLEAENIVRREVVDRSPPGVQYRLTAFGASLLVALDDLARLWTKRHGGCPVDAE
jgi:DNA-binding HxlR family transcriptional regulator